MPLLLFLHLSLQNIETKPGRLGSKWFLFSISFVPAYGKWHCKGGYACAKALFWFSLNLIQSKKLIKKKKVDLADEDHRLLDVLILYL